MEELNLTKRERARREGGRRPRGRLSAAATSEGTGVGIDARASASLGLVGRRRRADLRLASFLGQCDYSRRPGEHFTAKGIALWPVGVEAFRDRLSVSPSAKERP